MDSAAFGESFLEGLRRTNEENKYGKALELKDLTFYQDPNTRLYLASDASAGAALTSGSNTGSVFKILA